MGHLLRYDQSQLAMKSHIARIESAVEELRSEIKSETDGLRSDIAGLKNNLISGLIVIVAAMIGILFAAL